MAARQRRPTQDVDWIFYLAGLALLAWQQQRNQRNIMSAISEYAGRVQAHLDNISSAVDGLGTAVAGVGKDVLWLKDKIAELQNSNGGISPEDQALLDAIEARVGTLAINVGAVATAAQQLDAATDSAPPAPPPE